MGANEQDERTSVVILGGGIAGLEALLALADLAGRRAALTVVAPQPEFTYRPMLVREPFSPEPAQRSELEPWVAEAGGRFVLGAGTGVDAAAHELELADGARLPYDILVACTGGRTRPAFERAAAFGVGPDRLDVDELLARSAADATRTLAFIVPPGVTWPLPIYELALMTRSRSEETGRGEVRIVVVTPEEAPLALFGRTASDGVAELLSARRIEFRGGTHVSQAEDGALAETPGGRPLEAGAAVALPVVDGPALAGLPSDERGFIPIDAHARVPGVEDVYAAGDGTTFPIKQGGLGTQQADAAATHIAARLGAPVEPEPFHPVLRGQLITGSESLHMRHDLTGGHGEGTASPDCLWWPPQKVAGRYLGAWLAHSEPHADLQPAHHPLDVEVSFPHEWHEDPMTLDPYRSPEVG